MKSWIWNRKSLLGLLPVLLAITHIGCGSDRTGPITVAVNSVNNAGIVQVGTTAPFSASVLRQVSIGNQVVDQAVGNQGVNWSVTCPATSCGAVSPSSTVNQGITTYTPPQSLPKNDLEVTITATSIAKASAQAFSMVLVPSVTVTVTPQSPTIPFGGIAQFVATTTGDTHNTGVHWALVHQEGSFLIGFHNGCVQHMMNVCGTISSPSSASGVPITYTAPASPLPFSPSLIATSVADTNAFFAVPITLPTTSSPANARDAAHEVLASKPVNYAIIDLGTLGGSASNGFGGPSNRGWVTGDANLAGDQNEHAALWRDGGITDLGTLGGLNSSVPFPVKDDRGLVVGVAQTAEVDPLGELWGTTFVCTFAICQGSENLVRGFVWKDGVMTALPTLGGNNNGASGANNRGQIVGGAETANQDPNCVPPQVLDISAVVWGPQPGQIEVLPTFPGDSSAVALAINDKGQVVGTSGQCQGPTSGLAFQHAVLWQHATVTELGTLGGAMFNAANGINNRGQVVGQSDLPGEAATHAFLWQNGVMTDLGTLPGDSNSVAFDINDKGQVVGNSCDVNFNCRPFLWEDGVMTDLNTLIPTNSALFLIFGAGINNRGEITGSACVLSNGACTSEVPAFLAVPCDDAHASFDACADRGTGAPLAAQATGQGSSVIPPQGIRQHLQRRRGFGPFVVGEIKQQ